MHLKIGEITRRWLVFPHALALSELLHQVLIIYVNKLCYRLRTVVIQQAVNLIDGLSTKLDPLASDKNGGAGLERQIRVELQHDPGHFGDRGPTERLPTVFLDSKIEERIGGGKPHSGTNERLNRDS